MACFPRYVRVFEGVVEETVAVVEGVCWADFDEQGRLLGVEAIAPCGDAVERFIAADAEIDLS